MKNYMNWVLAVSFMISAMLFSGWVYMLVISIFNPISYRNAFTIALILNTIALAFNHGRSLNERE
jgi:hypothetical protein